MSEYDELTLDELVHLARYHLKDADMEISRERFGEVREMFRNVERVFDVAEEVLSEMARG
ncbi:hypothetical protein LCGC14_0338300 [marine sediment metagenome]|uniref:Uncharacterized protein n=1 Tax=marine sediment metagenome TaxID=412755 RepID=A0A0F9W1S2_9ZZZZ